MAGKNGLAPWTLAGRVARTLGFFDAVACAAILLVVAPVPHPRRLFIPGFSAHVFQRALNGARVFEDEEDFAVFVDLVGTRTKDHHVAVHGYCILNTHYHLLVTPSTRDGVSRAMQRIEGAYVRHFNRKHARFGTVWAGRFKSKVIEDERYWLTAMRYIEQNPVAAGLSRTPADYRWSSYTWHAHGVGPEWLAGHPVYDGLGSTPAERQEKYRLLDRSVPLEFETG
jgi:putative transposase